jgi:hypothetical protein
MIKASCFSNTLMYIVSSFCNIRSDANVTLCYRFGCLPCYYLLCGVKGITFVPDFVKISDVVQNCEETTHMHTKQHVYFIRFTCL